MDRNHDHTWPPRSLMARLDPQSVSALLRIGRRVEHAPGTTLMNLGERSTHLMVLLEGHVQVVTSSAEGKSVLLALRSRGDLIGELAGMDTSPRMATVRTAGPVSARALTAAEFHTFLERDPAAARTVTGAVASKLRSAAERILDYSSQDVPTRLARVLMRLLRDHGVPSPHGTELGIRISQPELASIISASEAAVYKALTDLRKDGVVHTGYRRFTVTDVPALAAAAGFPRRPAPIPDE